MNNEQIRIMKALASSPGLFWHEASRRNILYFVQYMKSNYQVTDFHRSYMRVIDKFARGEIKKLIIQAPPQHGKALSIDTPVLTTKGWKRHCDLQVGDEVFGDDGQPKKVLWNSGVYDWPTMSVDFADGFSMIAAREHEWKVYCDHDNHKGRVEEVLETQNIFKCRQRRAPFIKGDCGFDMPERELPVEPYLLGYWLGDGCSQNGSICSGEEDAWNLAQFGKVKIQKKGHTAPYYRTNVVGLSHKLRIMGLRNNKHIPIEYLLSSRAQRFALLQGLMDTDGYVNVGRGMCEFCQKKNQLAEDVYILLRSLGFKPVMHEYAMMLNGRNVGRKVRICFVPNRGDRIFRLPRKQERLDNKTTADRTDKTRLFITNISEAGNTLVNCIQVEGGMYLAGYELVPTHNSEISSRYLPAFMLGKNPDLKICICSYASTIACDFNRDVQRIIDTPEYRGIFPDSFLNGSNVVTVSTNYLRNSNVFEMVGHVGGLRVVGRGGALTSKTVDVMIMDDLYKDAQEAGSPVIRAGAWDWFTKVAQSRLHNDSQQLIVFTRWHPDDIIGKILETEKVIEAKTWADLDNAGNSWVLVNYEAIKRGEPTEIDGRQEGEALWPARHSLERLEGLRKIDAVGFECLYQGNPGNAESKLYQPFKVWVNKADWGAYVRSGCYIDVADEGDDFLCSISYDIYKSGQQLWNAKKNRFEPLLFALVTDIIFTQENTEVTSETVPMQINANRVQKAWIESNNGGSQFGKTVSKRVRAQCHLFYQGANKEARITTSAPFVNTQIIMPIGWETRYPAAHKHLSGFLRAFTANTHDDIEDCMTGIYEKELADGNTAPYNIGSVGVVVH